MSSVEANLSDQRGVIMDSLPRVSTVDGRDATYTHELAPFLSEEALHRYRAVVEIEALIAISESEFPSAPYIDDGTKLLLRGAVSDSSFDPKPVAEYDHLGRNGIKPLEHDVKAVELYLDELLEERGLSHLKEWVHFAATSEDINNIAMNLMLRDAINLAWLPSVLSIMDRLAELSEEHSDTPVLGRTHLMPATPTTYGKRFSHYLNNMAEVMKNMSRIRLSAKFSGPVGNYNSVTTLAPEFDYEEFARRFVERFGFEFSENANQRNSHISIAELLGQIKIMNTVVTDLSENIRLGLLLGELIQDPREGQAGSSVMPHKVNPWRAESAEGNLERSSSEIDGATDGLIKSQLERDSSDHPWERGYGDMLGKSLIGLKYLDADLGVISVNTELARTELDRHFEVLAEPLQIAGRMEGDPESYMRIKEATRGKQLNQAEYQTLVEAYIQDPDLKQRLLDLTPSTYLGKAPDIARRTVTRYQEFRTKIERGILDDAKAVDAVLFDLDGTLQVGDKDELIARLCEITSRMGLGFNSDEITEFANRSDWRDMRKLMVDAYNKLHLDALISENEFQSVNMEVSGTLDHKFRLAEGAKETLEALIASGKRLGLVTTRGSNSLMRLLRMHGIDGFFDVIINRDDINRRKPHPEPIAIALKRMGITDTARVLYVGDNQEDDVIAGNALGAKTVLITDEQLDPLGANPTYKFDNIKELAYRFTR